MIDRNARDQLAESIRHLGAGRITNVEFEERVLVTSPDPAIQAVFLGGPWLLYSDLWPYYLRGRDKVARIVRREAARWVLFRKTDLIYEWPVDHKFSVVLWLPLNIITFGMAARLRQRSFERKGDFSVWPFIRHADYDLALKMPPYLSALSNSRIESDTYSAPLRGPVSAPHSGR